MNLLAVDTTTEVCAVAVHRWREMPSEPASDLEQRRAAATPQGPLNPKSGLSETAAATSWLEYARLAPRQHNRHILTMIDEALRAADLTVRCLDLIAFGAGPGSFTGVRIGTAVAQGVGLAAGAKLIPVPSSAVAAETWRRVNETRGDVTLRRLSRSGWYYCARYRLDEDGAHCLAFDELVAEDELPADAIDGDRMDISARILGELALTERANARNPGLAQPFYVGGDSPWQPSAR